MPYLWIYGSGSLPLWMGHCGWAAVDGGLSQSQAARRFAVSPMTVVGLMAHRRETGSIPPCSQDRLSSWITSVFIRAAKHAS